VLIVQLLHAHHCPVVAILYTNTAAVSVLNKYTVNNDQETMRILTHRAAITKAPNNTSDTVHLLVVRLHVPGVDRVVVGGHVVALAAVHDAAHLDGLQVGGIEADVALWRRRVFDHRRTEHDVDRVRNGDVLGHLPDDRTVVADAHCDRRPLLRLKDIGGRRVDTRSPLGLIDGDVESNLVRRAFEFRIGTACCQEARDAQQQQRPRMTHALTFTTKTNRQDR